MEDLAEEAEQCREQRKKLARKQCLRNSYGCFRFSVVGIQSEDAGFQLFHCTRKCGQVVSKSCQVFCDMTCTFHTIVDLTSHFTWCT